MIINESVPNWNDYARPLSWIGVDLDKTLAHFDGEYTGPDDIGEPIPEMLERITIWLQEGKDVRIFTARAWYDREVLDTADPGCKIYNDALIRRNEAVTAIRAIQLWTQKHLGYTLPVTCEKDPYMFQLWDDRAVQVIPNTGIPVTNPNA